MTLLTLIVVSVMKRIFISNDQVPYTWMPIGPYSCLLDSLLYCAGRSCYNEVAADLVLLPPQETPVDIINFGGAGVGYTASTESCIDCTLRETQIQPDFWK